MVPPAPAGVEPGLQRSAIQGAFRSDDHDVVRRAAFEGPLLAWEGGAVLEDIVRVDWEQVRFRRAASGLVAILLAGLFAQVAGTGVETAVLAVVLVLAAAGDGRMSARLPGMIGFTIVGAVVGVLAFASAGNALAVALVLGSATYIGTLAAAAGPVWARSGLLLSLWALLALLLGSVDTPPGEVAVAFLVGGGIAIAITALRLWLVAEDPAEEATAPEPADTVEGEPLARPQQVGSAVTSPIGIFALLKAGAVVLAVVLGFWWFASYPLWVAITVIVVVKPSSNQTASVAVQRTLGTALGVAAAVAVAQVLPRGDAAVIIALLVSAFLMIAFMNASYTLFAAALTAVLVFAQRLIEADAFEAGWERLLATATGAAIALGVMAIAQAIKPRLSSR